MSTPLLTIIIVTWNSLKYLPFCLESIYKQTFRDFSVIIIDNGSTDGTIEFVKQEYPMVTLLRNPKNLGFCHANNQGIKLAKSEYVLLCNPDIILERGFLEAAMKTIRSDDKIASVGEKLLKATWDTEELPKPVKTDIIDSCGLKMLKSHQVIEIGADEKDEGQHSAQKEIFGVSGALMLIRREGLEDIQYQEEYFDENFFSYKEDVDLAWRLRLAGYKAIYEPKARAYHFRGVSRDIRRQERSKFVNQLSYKNHWLMIVKNQTLVNLILYFPFIFFYELGKLIYILFFEPSTFGGLYKFFVQLGQTLDKRKFVMLRRRVDSREIRKWIS